MQFLTSREVPKEPPKKSPSIIQTVDVGSEVALDAIPGRLFECNSSKSKFHIPGMGVRKRYIAVTRHQIIELATTPYKTGMATVIEAHELEALVRVKFKRGEVITFHYKNNVTKKYSMEECADCVVYLKEQMTENGFSTAQHAPKKYNINVETAQGILDTIKEMEADFSLHPSYDVVEEVMNLLREAVERFGEANDKRYLEAITHIQSFLSRADVVKILDDHMKKGTAKEMEEDFSSSARKRPASQNLKAATESPVTPRTTPHKLLSATKSRPQSQRAIPGLTEILATPLRPRRVSLEDRLESLMSNGASDVVDEEGEDEPRGFGALAQDEDDVERELNALLGALYSEFDNIVQNFQSPKHADELVETNDVDKSIDFDQDEFSFS